MLVLRALLVGAGLVDVGVDRIEHAFPIADPEALFRSIPTWAAPMRPRLDDAQRSDGASAFAELVRERSSSDGLPLDALLAVGSR